LKTAPCVLESGPFTFREQTLAASTSPITELLRSWRRGDQAALERLVPLVYDDLRRMARHQLRGERGGHTLQATALVNEMYLRLPGVERLGWQDRAHFFAIAARLMRRVLIEAARARKNQKRGGGAVRITVDENQLAGEMPARDVVALDDALRALAKMDPRKSQVVELRYFGGLTLEETASVLGISSDTVMRDWKVAKLWLMREMAKGRERLQR
jgi:RNA polymerase sigma factor (TIGR02999 family)